MSDYEWPRGSQMDRKLFVRQILWTLYLDGPITDESGRALSKLHDALRQRRVNITGTSLSLIIKELSDDKYRKGGFVRRTMNEKRTFLIELRVDPYNPGPEGFPRSPWPKETKAMEAEAPAVEAEAPAEEAEPVDLPATGLEVDPVPAGLDGRTQSLDGTEEDVAELEEFDTVPVGNGLVPVYGDIDVPWDDDSVVAKVSRANAIMNDVMVQVLAEQSRTQQPDLAYAIPEVLKLSDRVHELENELRQREAHWSTLLSQREQTIRGLSAQINSLHHSMAALTKG